MEMMSCLAEVTAQFSQPWLKARPTRGGEEDLRWVNQVIVVSESCGRQ